ncbi:MAG: hypothetical protein JSS83_13105 [Cyanobacteria bacterium SZAS LIN-3]|nr:hypothetical protein [Cyanobacteria bacterium SZAS LIN-3]
MNQREMKFKFDHTTALINGAMQARLSWLADSNRWLATAAFEKGKSEMAAELALAPSLDLSAYDMLIPDETTARLLEQVDNVCHSFLTSFDAQADGVKYSDGECDEACEALSAALNRWLARIVALNGSIPSSRLRTLHATLNQG